MEQEIIDGKEVKAITNKKDFVNEAMGVAYQERQRRQGCWQKSYGKYVR
jgi:hypothetical protein